MKGDLHKRGFPLPDLRVEKNPVVPIYLFGIDEHRPRIFLLLPALEPFIIEPLEHDRLVVGVVLPIVLARSKRIWPGVEEPKIPIELEVVVVGLFLIRHFILDDLDFFDFLDDFLPFLPCQRVVLLHLHLQWRHPLHLRDILWGCVLCGV